MTDSFLRQYEMGFVEGNASGAMCSYNLIDGIPNCASPMLLNGQIRSAARIVLFMIPHHFV